jgi:hypothetical protein
VNAAPPPPSLVDQMLAAGDNAEIKQYVADEDLSRKIAGSAYYSDLTNSAQAMVKIQLGRDLDIKPMVAIQSISVANNKVSISAELQAAMLKRAGYSWRFIQNDLDGTEIAVYFQGKPIMDLNPDGTDRPATVRWDRTDSERARLLEPRGASKMPSVHELYPKDMCYWRCITRFMRKYAPEVSKGMTLLTPDEMYEISTQDVGIDYEARTAELLAAAAEKEKANAG